MKSGISVHTYCRNKWIRKKKSKGLLQQDCTKTDTSNTYKLATTCMIVHIETGKAWIVYLKHAMSMPETLRGMTRRETLSSSTHTKQMLLLWMRDIAPAWQRLCHCRLCPPPGTLSHYHFSTGCQPNIQKLLLTSYIVEPCSIYICLYPFLTEPKNDEANMLW